MSGVTMPTPPTPPTPPAPPSPTPRRMAAPSWLDLRLVLGVVLVLASVLIGAKVVSGARQTYPRVTVRHDLAAGAVLTAGDLHLAQVQLPDHGHGVYLNRVRDAVGKKLSRAVSAGELLPASALDEVNAQTTVTVPLARGSAPQLHKGQRIELWVSSAKCSSMVLLPDVTVQAVHADSGGSFGAGSDGQDVVISVPPELAERVVTALAIDEVRLRAGVLAGASPGDAPPLPDLTPCAGADR
jgi:SAF domain-containing protein